MVVPELKHAVCKQTNLRLKISRSLRINKVKVLGQNNIQPLEKMQSNMRTIYQGSQANIKDRSEDLQAI